MENNNQNIEQQKQIGYKVVNVRQDRTLFLTTIALVLTGIMAVLSASLPMCIAKNITPLHVFIQHMVWVLLGFVGLLWFSKFDYKRLKNYAIPFGLVVIFLLLLVKFTPLGVVINGGRRWISLGGFQFQPSELSKLSLIMLMTGIFTSKISLFNLKMWFQIGIIMTMLVFIFIQPNLSMVVILFAISFLMYVCSGKTLKYLIVMILIGISLIFMVKNDTIDLSKFLSPHQVERIKEWVSPNHDHQGQGYQPYHSQIAISSGGIIGQGYGSSKEKRGWLPEAHTDYIFAVFSEEMGFLGSVFVLFLFLTFLTRGVSIAYTSPDLQGKLLAIGITSSIIVQAYFNMAVALAIIPATGITLPFISYGGSSLFVTMCMVGILLNVSKRKRVLAYK